MTQPCVVRGARWDGPDGRYVVAELSSTGEVTAIRHNGLGQGKASVLRLPSDVFMEGRTFVDEVEEAKKMKTSNLIYSLVDWKSAAGLRGLDLFVARVRAAEAELDARIPPRST